MLEEGMPYSAAVWHVRSGSESEFVTAWNEFIQWTVDQVPGAGMFRLLRDVNHPTRFMSFGSWESVETLQGWRQDDRFGELYGRCAELCQDVDSGAYGLTASHDSAVSSS